MIFNIDLFLILFIVLYLYITYSLYSLKRYNNFDCISLIVPSTENDFLRCNYQLFNNSDSFKFAQEIILSISSVTNFSRIKEIIKQYIIYKKIILGLRKSFHNAASNRNFGYILSQCKIISYFDMDDIMSRNRLSVIYKAFKLDETTEFILHRYTTSKNNLGEKRNIHNPLLYKYNITYNDIQTSYLNNYNKSKSNEIYCCRYIKQLEEQSIHNGWPSMRRYIMKRIKYNEKYDAGQDSDFNGQVILNGFNISILNLYLGYYKKDNLCQQL